MKDTTKKTVPTGSTTKRKRTTKDNETIVNNENSAILCKSDFPKCIDLIYDSVHK